MRLLISLSHGFFVARFVIYTSNTWLVMGFLKFEQYALNRQKSFRVVVSFDDIVVGLIFPLMADSKIPYKNGGIQPTLSTPCIFCHFQKKSSKRFDYKLKRCKGRDYCRIPVCPF